MNYQVQINGPGYYSEVWCKTLQEAAQIRADHSDITHNCWAEVWMRDEKDHRMGPVRAEFLPKVSRKEPTHDAR